MSAYVVDKSHINAMILSAQHLKYSGDFSWYHNGERHVLNNDNQDEKGQMLLDENIKSVGYRYEDSNLTELPGRTDADYLLPFKVKYVQRTPKPLEAISITKCYMYQACEHDEWDNSEAKAFCKTLIDEKISELPGYDDAPWEWHDKEYENCSTIKLV